MHNDPEAVVASRPAEAPAKTVTASESERAFQVDDVTHLSLADLGPGITDVIAAVALAGRRHASVVLAAKDRRPLVIEPDSEAMRLTILLADMQHERQLTRTRPGLQAARSLGRTGGRPSVINEPRRTEIARLLAARGVNGRQLLSYAEIAEKTGVSRSTIARHAKAIRSTTFES